MKPRYLTRWSLQSACRQSAALIRVGSHLRLVGIANERAGISHTEVMPVNSSVCAGQGNVINGVLIGRPQ